MEGYQVHMTLDELHIGRKGRITAVGGEGILRCRLLDMGLIPQTIVSVTRSRRWATRWSFCCAGTV